MHKFGDGTMAKSRASGVADQIKVNPPAKASRKSKVPGRAPANLGRPHMNQPERTQIVVNEENDGILDRTGQKQKVHNFVQTVENI
jgi:hypothetical protein